MPQLRVSVVEYLNTAPLVWGMQKGRERGRFELEFTLPSKCADDLRGHKVDVGIIPAIEYQRTENVEIIPGVSIASKNTVKSVLLFSKAPIEQAQTVAMDTSSRSSVALTTILLRKFYGRDFEAIPVAPDLQTMLQQADAALLIGDPALTASASKPAPFIYDLASEWKKFTGLPFVFALWVGRRDARLAEFCADFIASRDEGVAHVNEIAAEHAPRLGLSVEDVRIYLTENIDYTLDDENLKGLRLFYRLARELGLIESEKELRFVARDAKRARG
jgi:chorismate dehydratase